MRIPASNWRNVGKDLLSGACHKKQVTHDVDLLAEPARSHRSRHRGYAGDRPGCRRALPDGGCPVGPLDILVNNAGIWRETPALQLDAADWHQVIAVNLTAPVLLATLAACGMADRGYGRIVNITSIHGRFAAESALAYAAAKAGLEQATRNLAVDLASDGILVNAVAPGFISTRLSVMDGIHERDTDWFRRIYVENARLPLRRHAEPDEVAPSVAWLASEQNTYITGQVLGIDGGLSITF
jgi:NAD(P)-dependent dehydrogenase (short-subunit alcohol dehydrogenase family)